jgi:hypothetical protein
METSSIDILMYTPAIPMILRSLMEAPEGRDESDLPGGSTEERPYVTKALEALLERGLIVKDAGKFRLTDQPENIKKIENLLRFYEDLQKTIRIELTFRGILNAIEDQCLVHLKTLMEMMAQEGFGDNEVDEILVREKSAGYVEQLKIVYPSKQGMKWKLFPIIPVYYYQDFVVKGENVFEFRAKFADRGDAAVEEDYLLGSYPKEMAHQAREYIESQKTHIKRKIKSGVYEMWSYYTMLPRGYRQG